MIQHDTILILCAGFIGGMISRSFERLIRRRSSNEWKTIAIEFARLLVRDDELTLIEFYRGGLDILRRIKIHHPSIYESEIRQCRKSSSTSTPTAK